MTWKKALAIGALSTALSALACIVYAKIYNEAFMVDFSAVAGNVNFVAASAFGCFMMAIGYRLAYIWRKEALFGWLNIVYALLSFVSIIGIFGFNLPLDIKFPEMFPGLVIPMHFFPIIGFLTVQPFFATKQQ